MTIVRTILLGFVPKSITLFIFISTIIPIIQSQNLIINGAEPQSQSRSSSIDIQGLLPGQKIDIGNLDDILRGAGVDPNSAAGENNNNNQPNVNQNQNNLFTNSGNQKPGVQRPNPNNNGFTNQAANGNRFDVNQNSNPSINSNTNINNNNRFPNTNNPSIDRPYGNIDRNQSSQSINTGFNDRFNNQNNQPIRRPSDNQNGQSINTPTQNNRPTNSGFNNQFNSNRPVNQLFDPTTTTNRQPPPSTNQFNNNFRPTPPQRPFSINNNPNSIVDNFQLDVNNALDVIPPTSRPPQVIGGVYSSNQTLRLVNSPYRVTRDLVVDSGVTLTIQTGVQIFLDSGVGIKIRGTLYAVGTRWSRIKLLPHQLASDYDDSMPVFKLVDGPDVSQGRLQVLHNDKWRAVCTKQTNWTRTDFSVACQSMGYGGGGFWRWYRRNNDTYPFVMPKPDCAQTPQVDNLWKCPSFKNDTAIPLTEGLCQGEDDIGITCWGPPTFTGWRKHWKGLEFLNSPFSTVCTDPNCVAMHRQSLSRLEYVDFTYPGFDGNTKNATAAIFSEGVPPFMNDIRVFRSAGNAIRIIEPTGPVLLANSTLSYNRGHGLIVDRTTDGRVFVNETRIENNYGDGIRYRQRTGGQLQDVSIVTQQNVRRSKRQTRYFENETPLVNFCETHEIDKNRVFPYFVEARLPSNSQVDCFLRVQLPSSLDYIYTLQFVDMQNGNARELGTETYLLVCDGGQQGTCQREIFRLPVYDNIVPQSVALQNTGRSLWLGIKHNSPDLSNPNVIYGAITVQFRIHATVAGIHGYPQYGLNVTNSVIRNNYGTGILAMDVRDQTFFSNVTVKGNQGLAGIHVMEGAADIMINSSYIEDNWGDGVNISYVGGSVYVNGTQILRNRLRGFAMHQNSSSPFYNVRQEVTFRGQPSAYSASKPLTVADNRWGGVLIGNFCVSDWYNGLDRQQVIITYVQFIRNHYHPSLEFFSCQHSRQPITTVRLTGSRFENSDSICVRMSPLVNVNAELSDNTFMNNSKSALYIRNRDNPHLSDLPATVKISRNKFKFNRGPYIVHIGLNEDAPKQVMQFNEQNEIRENNVTNPFPLLRARNRPYAALVVSSSNVVLSRNCFNNPLAEYEIATDLPEHAKTITATFNSWGSTSPEDFTPKIFDQFIRYNLAKINVDPFASTCNSQNPNTKYFNGFFRKFSSPSQPNVLGGIIYETADLSLGEYTVIDDLHIIPGAALTIHPGVVLKFDSGIGMLVEGELSRTETFNNRQRVLFTKTPFRVPSVGNIRIVDDFGYAGVQEGRLEVYIDNQWGTICNRSWTVQLAGMACNQMGMIVDPEFLENWLVYVKEPGDNPIVMSNIRCEEQEWDLTQCRHDGPSRNVHFSCEPLEVVGLRCVEPHWAGVRYSLLANPQLRPGSGSMSHWTIEKAGLFDYSSNEFNAALQIDWNYHHFSDVIIRDNFWNGMDVVYNDLLNKPSIQDCEFLRNRRHGVRVRSVGLSMRNVLISENKNAGVRYNPIVSASLQRDVVTWLDGRENTWQSNNVKFIPTPEVTSINLEPSGDKSRIFLVAHATSSCALQPQTECRFTIGVSAANSQTTQGAYVGIQVVNRPSNNSDEDLQIVSASGTWSVRNNLIQFPLIIEQESVQLVYSRSEGRPGISVLLMYLSRNSYIDRFLHILDSEISHNAYGLSTLHYSNFTHHDTGDVLIRWEKEKLWIQKCNLHHNRQAVIWVNGPLQDVHTHSPIAEITYHVDNCSIANNNGSIIETHRDLHSSANVFHWWMWSSTLKDNSNSGVSIMLPDTYDLTSAKQHEFKVSESRFEDNRNFQFQLSGYTALVNVSSNNFTRNTARDESGLMIFRGMEKQLTMQRNRFWDNRVQWVIQYNMQSQTVKDFGEHLPAVIQYNYFENNYFVQYISELIDLWPRSYCLSLRGTQKVNVNFNRFSNPLLDFEAVVGLKALPIVDTVNVSRNFWGTQTDPGTLQRIFDFDDWNSYSVADFNPYYVTQEKFIDWHWRPERGQSQEIPHSEPSADNLHGRMLRSITLSLNRTKWPGYPETYKPVRPYRVRRDLTIMPGATLTLDPGVELHIYPNVRILVLGNIIANGNRYQPIRFKPLNVTELMEVTGANAKRYRRDVISTNFPVLHRSDSFYQKFNVFLVEGEKSNRFSGFLEIYNATTGEMVPICDRQFTRRNAEVVCREMGRTTRNAYFWVAPRYDYNPRLRIVKSYSEPRQCLGHERKLDECDLRLTGDRSQWYCTDTEHFVYIDCKRSRAVNEDYVANWGGIVFAHPIYEQAIQRASEGTQPSVLRNVDIVGAGYAHNDSSASLTMIYRTPTLINVNITNSSMDGLVLIAPRQEVNLARVNITDNNGHGLSIVALNFQGENSETDNRRSPPITDMTSIPYEMHGLLDLCSAQRTIRVETRILVYFKYDSYATDCVKWFQSGQFQSSNTRPLAFRILVANLFDPHNPAGRPDAIKFYKSAQYKQQNFIDEINYANYETLSVVSSPGSFLGLHLRATAADQRYGFIAEVVTLPSAPDSAPVNQIAITESRFQRNDRGAMFYASAGDSSPNLYMDQCYVAENGHHIWGNFSTTERAMELLLHNTQEMRLLNSMIWRNQGGLRMSAQSTQNLARLSGLIKNSVFADNEQFPALTMIGKNYQKVYIIANYFGKNRARYHDTVFVQQVTTNFTENVFYNNTGLHTVDLTGFPGIRAETLVFDKNRLIDNIALGHGYQYEQSYGYLPYRRRRMVQHDRARRQISDDAVNDASAGVSFDWWAHVGADTGRYRSTVLLGSAQQELSNNIFSNPLNDFELTTANRSAYDRTVIDARSNYWGYPGTEGVAAGKIRDGEDYPYLIDVNYRPVLESNTSVLDDNCPGGWFSAGFEQFKSCFLYVGGVAKYDDAVSFCKTQDAIIPYFRGSDSRQQTIIDRIVEHQHSLTLEMERYSKYQSIDTTRFWVSGTSIPSGECGFMSTRSPSINVYNCDALLPFICERGTKPYSEPFIWTPAGITLFVIAILLLCCMACLFGAWLFKSRRRDKEFFERKVSLRMSVRSNRQTNAEARARYAEEKRKEYQMKQALKAVSESENGRTASPDRVEQAHRQMVLGREDARTDSTLVTTITPKKHRSSRRRDKDHRPRSGSSTSLTTSMSEADDKKSLASTYLTESAYRSDYSPTGDTYFSTTDTNGRSSKPLGRPTEVPSTPSLSSFASPNKTAAVPVHFRTTNGGNKPILPVASTSRQRDTAASEMSTATYCSTCRASSTISYDPSGCSECAACKSARVTSGASTFSTITEEGDTASVSTRTRDSGSTVTNDENPYEVPHHIRRPPSFQNAMASNSTIHRYNTENEINEEREHVPPPRPGHPPPPVPSFMTATGASYPNRAFVSTSPEASRSQSDLRAALYNTQSTMRPPVPSRSMADLQYATANQQASAWPRMNEHGLPMETSM